MSIRAELLAMTARAAAALSPPPIASALIASPHPAPDKETEFGLVALADGCAGLYYAWLGTSQADMPARFRIESLLGRPALEVAAYVLGEDDGARSVGIAAINAVTEHVYRRAGFAPPAAADAFGGLVLESNDRLGMIGNFVPLVRRARDRGIATRVLERKAEMVTSGPDDFEISLDPRILRGCNKIICTGATLLNDSFDTMLAHCRAAEQVALVGPTVGFFPDVAFARGVDIVAGTAYWTARACKAVSAVASNSATARCARCCDAMRIRASRPYSSVRFWSASERPRKSEPVLSLRRCARP